MKIDFISTDEWINICIFLSGIMICKNDNNNYMYNYYLLKEYIYKLEKKINKKISFNIKRLLDVIYNNDNPIAKIDDIINYINVLNNIGIKKIYLCDNINLYNRFYLRKKYNINDIIYNEKIITDGDFSNNIDYENGYFFEYVNNICKHNFIIKVIISRNDNNDYKIIDSYIITDSFNGILPNKDTIYDIRSPGILVNYKKNVDNKKQIYCKYFYYPYILCTEDKTKILIKEKDNYEE